MATDTKTKVRELSVPAVEGQLGRVRDFVVEVCEDAGFSQRDTSNTKLAVDEACTNIIKHAYADKDSTGDIRVRAEIVAGELTLSLFDTGTHFDFTAVKDPDLDQYVETGRKGGFGVFLINRLMDGVDYRAADGGNELTLVKRSRSGAGGVLLEKRPLRSTLKYKFTMRAATGLFVLMAALWAFVFVRQTNNIQVQEASQWLEKRRVAESLANTSRDALLSTEEFSPERTALSANLVKEVETRADVAYARVQGVDGIVISSSNLDEIFGTGPDLTVATVLATDSAVTWRRWDVDGQRVRDIEYKVTVLSANSGLRIPVGTIHIGVLEDVVTSQGGDNRVLTSLIFLALFAVGLLLIMGLVSVFVKPIQVLTDGVRAIGDGNLEGKLKVDGPAEIGAIAGVFNDITDKFKKAQSSILEQEKMQKEMEVAKQIQHSLLPRKKPDVSGYDIAPLYQAAAEVGGDYYDFVQVDDDTVGVVVADVSGKGVPGSLVMTMIRTALRMEARGNKNASDVMSKMNAFVTDDMKKGMFVTMFYVILDSKNRIISYASAGHNPMILYRHETNETFFLNPKGFPVGISLPDEELFRRSISLEKIKLKKDDMLVIYTDGVTEAMNARRDQYGEDRLINIIKANGHLAPDKFIDALETDVKNFTAGHPQNDDITVVAVKEKLAADDVLFGIRKKLIDLVDVQGLSVKDACAQMKVSPATYYRYKKRLETMGERGLKNKVLRADTSLKRVSLEARKEIIEIIRENPDFGAKRIAAEYNEGKIEAAQVTERMVYDELKRLNMNTKELRLDYLRRNRLIDDDEATTGEDRKAVEDLLSEIAAAEEPSEPFVPTTEDVELVTGDDDSEFPVDTVNVPVDSEVVDGVGISIRRHSDGIAELAVNGHLDSVTTSTLEQRLKDVVADNYFKIIVNLSEVTYISSGGWGVFTGEVRNLRSRQGDIVLVGMGAEVFDVYELLGFAEVLRSFHTVDEAAGFLKLPAEERFVSAPAATDASPAMSFADEEVPGEGYVPEWESLQIEATTVGEKGDIAVVSLNGIIDTVSAESLRSALEKVISQGLVKIVVDMSSVEYVSSGGWGTFTERLREVRRSGGDVKLFGMDPDVYYVFTMLGFNIVLSSFDILTEAIDDFERTDAADRPDRPEPIAAATDAYEDYPPVVVEDDPAEPDDLLDIEQARARSLDGLVDWEEVGDSVVIGHLEGPIEASAVDALTADVDQQLAKQPSRVLFDLSKVTYISSTGWGMFAKALETTSQWGGTVGLFGLSPDLWDIYSLLEFQSFLQAYDSREAAIAGVGAQPAPPAATPDTVDFADEDAVPVDESDDVDDILGNESEGSSFEVLADKSDDGLGEWPEEPVVTESSADAGPSLGGPVDFEDDTARPASNLPDDLPDRPIKVIPAASEDPDPPMEAEEFGSSETPADAPKPGPDVPDRPGDGFKLTVDGADRDRNVNKDKKLRSMGWGQYGEKLRKKKDK